MTAAPAAAQLPRPGDTIAGKYVLDRLLGQGGMGAVFAAKHIKLSKAVAIKIMLADASNPEAAQRFINEGRAAANIQNEHVVRVDDVDEERGYAYMVLELLEGEDLAQVLERDPAHRLAPHVAVGYVLQALKGVIQAHAIGIVHRDLKPSNLFLAKRKDGSVVVKVLDFGISKAQGSSALAASPSALTSTKAMLGSPLYMSPEQLRSSKSVDQRADIWAIGIILYELMTGSLPFMGDNLGELFAAILERDPASLRTHVPDVPPALDEIVLRCLQRRPEHRFQTATELADALAPF
ncbi:MAG: serine/threonine protein kinase, partial [Labilithrix sp.]|nr:serine/threonine protein kinase [Labilithrix sp.]